MLGVFPRTELYTLSTIDGFDEKEEPIGSYFKAWIVFKKVLSMRTDWSLGNNFMQTERSALGGPTTFVNSLEWLICVLTSRIRMKRAVIRELGDALPRCQGIVAARFFDFPFAITQNVVDLSIIEFAGCKDRRTKQPDRGGTKRHNESKAAIQERNSVFSFSINLSRMRQLPIGLS